MLGLQKKDPGQWIELKGQPNILDCLWRHFLVQLLGMGTCLDPFYEDARQPLFLPILPSLRAFHTC
jgi:hypothetical protein